MKVNRNRNSIYFYYVLLPLLFLLLVISNSTSGSSSSRVVMNWVDPFCFVITRERNGRWSLWIPNRSLQQQAKISKNEKNPTDLTSFLLLASLSRRFKAAKPVQSGNGAMWLEQLIKRAVEVATQAQPLIRQARGQPDLQKAGESRKTPQIHLRNYSHRQTLQVLVVSHTHTFA